MGFLFFPLSGRLATQNSSGCRYASFSRGTLLEHPRLLAQRLLERVIAVHIQPLCVHALRFFAQLEVYPYIVFRNDARTVGLAFKRLFDGHLRHEIQVNVFRHIQNGTLDEVRGIERNKEMSRKSERLRIKGYETQIDTRFVIDL